MTQYAYTSYYVTSIECCVQKIANFVGAVFEKIEEYHEKTQSKVLNSIFV